MLVIASREPIPSATAADASNLVFMNPPFLWNSQRPLGPDARARSQTSVSHCERIDDRGRGETSSDSAEEGSFLLPRLARDAWTAQSATSGALAPKGARDDVDLPRQSTRHATTTGRIGQQSFVLGIGEKAGFHQYRRNLSRA